MRFYTTVIQACVLFTEKDAFVESAKTGAIHKSMN